MQSKKNSLFVGLLLSVLLSGCATTQESNPIDPWENWNRKVQYFNDEVDEYAMTPVAKAYRWVTPVIIDGAISRVFSNIDDIGVTINSLLQFKLKQAGMDMSRFLVNTTAGVAGVMDVATMIDLPKHNEDFGQTLGVWGVPPGPYLVLPFWGPSSPRGTAGLVGDAFFDPLNYTLFASFAVSAVSTLADVVEVTDTRAGFMTSEKIVNEAAIDRYSFIKESYLQYREFQINDGNISDEDDLLELDMNFEDEPSYKLELYSPTEK